MSMHSGTAQFIYIKALHTSHTSSLVMFMEMLYVLPFKYIGYRGSILTLLYTVICHVVVTSAKLIGIYVSNFKGRFQMVFSSFRTVYLIFYQNIT